MRIRRKPWARPELESCDFYIKSPDELNGKWRTTFVNDNPLHLELGCGKGGFISQKALQNQNINFVAVDIKSEMLGLAKRKLEQAYTEKQFKVENVKLMIKNIEQINMSFSKEDNIDRIYINFCNPWQKAKHKKRRLTHSRQLSKYRDFLNLNSQIWFKTDDDELFNESLEYFDESGFKIVYKSFDLHNSDFKENIITEHENMFTQEGKKIKFLIAEKI